MPLSVMQPNLRMITPPTDPLTSASMQRPDPVTRFGDIRRPTTEPPEWRGMWDVRCVSNVVGCDGGYEG